MIIKSFTAESAATALKRVREELGGDAIVLKTRQLDRKGRDQRVEITACLEKPTVAQSSRALSNNRLTAPADGPTVDGSERILEPQADETTPTPGAPADKVAEIDAKLNRLIESLTPAEPKETLPEAFSELTEKMTSADFSDDFVADTLGAAKLRLDESDDAEQAIEAALVERLAEVMAPELTFKPGDRVLFVGPAGSGKSSLLGKLAGRLCILEKRKVSLASLDRRKLSAYDEIRGYGDVIGANVVDPVAATSTWTPGSDEIALIDGPSLAVDPERIAAFAERVQKIQPTHVVAVFSSLMRKEDMVRFADLMEPLAPTHIAQTGLDLTGAIGSVVSTASRTGLKIALTTDSPAGIGQAAASDPARFARRLLGSGDPVAKEADRG